MVLVTQEGTKKLWAFLVGTYWVSIMTYCVLVKHYKKMIHLRGKEQAHEKPAPQQFSCLVRDIPPKPKGMSRREQVNAFFRKIHPDTYENCLIVCNLKKVEGKFSRFRIFSLNIVFCNFLDDHIRLGLRIAVDKFLY